MRLFFPNRNTIKFSFLKRNTKTSSNYTDTPIVSNARQSRRYDHLAYSRARLEALKRQPKATLSDMNDFSQQCRVNNQKRLNTRDNKIIAVNDWNNAMHSVKSEINKNLDFQNNEYGISAELEEHDRNLFNRSMINVQIKNILSENDIEIGKDESYIFKVDAYSNYVTVSGGDSNKCSKLESLLNADNNGKNLYEHIKMCGTWQHNEQITHDGAVLRYANELTKERIGVDLSHCVQQGNDYITEDGNSVRQMFKDQIKAHTSYGFSYQSELSLMYSYLDNASKYSFHNESIKNDLSIVYDENGLHDIGQEHSYGNGDTDWLNDCIKEYEAKTGRKAILSFASVDQQ